MFGFGKRAEKNMTREEMISHFETTRKNLVKEKCDLDYDAKLNRGEKDKIWGTMVKEYEKGDKAAYVTLEKQLSLKDIEYQHIEKERNKNINTQHYCKLYVAKLQRMKRWDNNGVYKSVKELASNRSIQELLARSDLTGDSHKARRHLVEHVAPVRARVRPGQLHSALRLPLGRQTYINNFFHGRSFLGSGGGFRVQCLPR